MANRLASNSLMEALVLGYRAAQPVAKLINLCFTYDPGVFKLDREQSKGGVSRPDPAQFRLRLQELMW